MAAALLGLAEAEAVGCRTEGHPVGVLVAAEARLEAEVEA